MNQLLYNIGCANVILLHRGALFDLLKEAAILKLGHNHVVVCHDDRYKFQK